MRGIQCRIGATTKLVQDVLDEESRILPSRITV